MVISKEVGNPLMRRPKKKKKNVQIVNRVGAMALMCRARLGRIMVEGEDEMEKEGPDFER